MEPETIEGGKVDGKGRWEAMEGELRDGEHLEKDDSGLTRERRRRKGKRRGMGRERWRRERGGKRDVEGWGIMLGGRKLELVELRRERKFGRVRRELGGGGVEDDYEYVVDVGWRRERVSREREKGGSDKGKGEGNMREGLRSRDEGGETGDGRVGRERGEEGEVSSSEPEGDLFRGVLRPVLMRDERER
ncbi:hypothetical protein Tco_1163872 [Tanacetum coccineum]